MRLDSGLKKYLRISVAAASALFAGGSAAPTCMAAAYVRVSQIGYEQGPSSRAYLMSTSVVSDATFAVKSVSGKTVASGPVSCTGSKWGIYTVYPLDFAVPEAGTYSIVVGGGAKATSPKFAVDVPANLYGSALQNSLSFYQNERDGADYIPSPLRSGPGHLSDTKAAVYKTPSFDSDDNIKGSLAATGATIDASGGWWDAGDYLKFVQTHSYVVAMMLVGVRDFPNQMGQGSGADFTGEAKFGLDWLQKMWNDDTRTLYYQVGIGTDFLDYDYQSDHDIWRLPQADDSYAGSDPTFQYIRNRPAFVAGAAGAKISPNLAGRLAADFALCYRVYRATDRAYANQCLLSAEHIFDLANTSPGSTLLTVAPNDFYPETEWRDDLELGATELYFALQAGHLPGGLPHTDANYYLTSAAKWAHAYINGPGDQTDTLNLYDVSGLAHFDLYRAIAMAGNPSGLAVSQSELAKDIKNQIDTSVAGAKDPFGFAWPWSGSDTVSHGTGLSVMAKEYYHLTGNGAYATDSRRWLANVLGANPWGLSFLVDDGATFPDCMQHQVANIVGSTNGKPPVLSGAAVEGPTDSSTSGSIDGMVTCPAGGGNAYKIFNGNGAVYKDNVQSYSTDEPAIDLTATSFLMFAWRIGGSPTGTP